jgi:hypothetical protein
MHAGCRAFHVLRVRGSAIHIPSEGSESASAVMVSWKRRPGGVAPTRARMKKQTTKIRRSSASFKGGAGAMSELRSLALALCFSTTQRERDGRRRRERIYTTHRERRKKKKRTYLDRIFPFFLFLINR